MAKIDQPEGDGDSYLTDEYVECVKAHDFNIYDARGYLVETLPEACALMSACSCEVSDGETTLGKPAKIVEFHTGGWSGAEELIRVLLNKMWVEYHHVKWERGGHFWFEVPT